MSIGATEPQHAALVGTVVAQRFEVGAVLGIGGSGVVYRIRDRRDGRELAMKVLSAHGESAAAQLAGFQREYLTLSQLAHPCIIEVYDYGIEGGFAYYTMELLEGQDLRERGARPWREVCGVLRDLASSLAILHSRRLVHRDVTLRNVRLTRAGRAKLLDFGAMVAVGSAKHLLGTPPFVPPEAVHLQALDGRADLYALGVLAYFMLTGRYPYPALHFSQLPALWAELPPSPRKQLPEIPLALDRLVMQLLQLERAERPATAAEVMERACGVASLPLSELPAVTRAYLSTPNLIGRHRMLQEVREVLATACDMHGSSLVLEGEEGSGRSRMLDACVLEAKLLGMTVLRAGASDASAGPYGVMRVLCAQLLDQASDRARRKALPWGSVLSHVLPELLRPGEMPCVGPQQRHLISAFRGWLLSVARALPIAIVVDDLEGVDEVSLGILAALATAASRRRLVILLAQRRGGPEQRPRGLFAKVSKTLELPPLDALQTSALLRSVFGEDTEHVPTLCDRVYRLGGGNPGYTMALCEQLVVRGVARYEAGRWILRAEAGAAELPESMAQVMRTRIEALDPDARALAEALALTELQALPVSAYGLLGSGNDAGAVYRALDRLVSSAIVVPDGDRFRFPQEALREELRRGLDAPRRRELHARLAVAVETADNPALLPHHMLQCGREREGVEQLLTLQDHPRVPKSPALIELLACALESADALRLPRRARLELCLWLSTCTSVLGLREQFERYAGRARAALERDSGFLDVVDLEASPESHARIAEALSRARERYEAQSDEERAFPPQESLLRLGELCTLTAGLAGIALDLAMIEALPNLEPWAVVLPGLHFVQLHIVQMKGMLSSDFARAQACANDVLAGFARGAAQELAPNHRRRIRNDAVFALGILDAVSGLDRAYSCVDEFEHESRFRVLGWQVRMVYELAHGDNEAAAQCRRRAELLQLQEGGGVLPPGTTTGIEMQIAIQSEDLIAIKRVRERIEAMAETFPGWRAHLVIVNSYYQRFQGDLAGALTTLEPLLADPELPGRRHSWCVARVAHLGLLDLLGRSAEAVERGTHYLELTKQHQANFATSVLRRALAEPLARVGRIDEAVQLADRHITEITAAGVEGVVLSNAYEMRARIALAARDETALRTYAELTARAFKRGSLGRSNARYQRLLRDAEAEGLLVLTSDMSIDAVSSLSLPSSSSVGNTAASRLMACVGLNERSREGLRMMMDMTGAAAGYLFAIHGERLELLATIDDEGPAFHELGQLLGVRLKEQLEAAGAVTMAAEVEPASEQRYLDGVGRGFEAMLLFGTRDNVRVPVAVVALHHQIRLRGPLRRDVLDAIARSLTESSDMRVKAGS